MLGRQMIRSFILTKYRSSAMRQIVSLNRPGKLVSDPTIPGAFPQQPDAEEFAGTAFLVTPLGALVDPLAAQPIQGGSPLWLLACSLIEGNTTICRVEAIYQVTNMSDTFQLKTGRSGASVQALLLSRPGRGDNYLAQCSRELSVLNVHFEDIQRVRDSAYVFRPAYDRKSSTGAWISSWDFEPLFSNPSANFATQITWTDDQGRSHVIMAQRTPPASLTLLPGNVIDLRLAGTLSRMDIEAGVRFDMPCGIVLSGSVPEGAQPVPKPLWVCWIKPLGDNLVLSPYFLSEKEELISFETRPEGVSNTGLLHILYYFTR